MLAMCCCKVNAKLNRILELLKKITPAPRAHLTGGRIVIVVKDSNPDVAYAISGVQAEDAKGNVIPDEQLTYEVSSTDDTVVAVTPDPNDQTKGNTHFGNPGVATVNVQVKDPAGDLLGSFAASFTVTAGDPTQIVGGEIKFGNLAETP